MNEWINGGRRRQTAFYACRLVERDQTGVIWGVALRRINGAFVFELQNTVSGIFVNGNGIIR